MTRFLSARLLAIAVLPSSPLLRLTLLLFLAPPACTSTVRGEGKSSAETGGDAGSPGEMEGDEPTDTNLGGAAAGGKTSGGAAGGEASSGGASGGESAGGTTGDGGGMIAATHCDGATLQTLPYIVDSLHVPSGYLGDAISDVSASTDGCPSRLGSAQGNCHVFEYNGGAGTQEWAGVVWQYPLHNWGTDGGVCFASEPTAVSLYARGAVGGEIVSFSAGNSGSSLSDVVLTDEWQQITIELLEVDTVDGEWNGFGWSAQSPDGSIEFYIDDIRWIAE